MSVVAANVRYQRQLRSGLAANLDRRAGHEAGGVADQEIDNQEISSGSPADRAHCSNARCFEHSRSMSTATCMAFDPPEKPFREDWHTGTECGK
jgi:hypothetical protein